MVYVTVSTGDKEQKLWMKEGKIKRVKREPLKDISNITAKKKDSSSHQYNNYYCETEPSVAMDKHTPNATNNQKMRVFYNDQDFDKVVEYTEPGEEETLNVIQQDNLLMVQDDSQQTLQFCEQIEEVDEESLQNSLIMLPKKKEERVGP